MCIGPGPGPNNVIFIGGIHAGFAPSTMQIAQTSADYFCQHMNLIPPEATLGQNGMDDNPVYLHE